MWRSLLGLLWGVLLIVIGVALASDYRGIATRHIDLSMQIVRPVSPLRWTDERLARRRTRFILFDRVFGVLIILMGVGSLIAGGSLLLSQLR